jgi:hypothetical protein
MKLELIRQVEADGNWFKIIGAGGWPFKCIRFNEENETEKRNEALAIFREIEDRATRLNIVILKSVEI